MQKLLEKWQIALIKDIRDYLDDCYWNKEQKQMSSPFDNTGESFETKDLKIKAYEWGDDNDWNLKYGDIEITWYKYFGRGTSINKDMSIEEWIEFYNNLRKSIKTHFGKYAPDGKN